MQNLALKPLTVDDFSGGMTDHFLQGDPKRFQKATNFLIDADRKLFVRPGSYGFDSNGNHRLSKKIRIGSFLHFENSILVQQEREIHYLNPNWTELTGPSGNKAVGGGDQYSAFSHAFWNDHIYFTSSGFGKPGKLYRGSDGAMKVRTAGLPYPYAKPRYTTSSLLSACIILANDLRASMLSHINDTTLHGSVDKWSKSYFTAQTFTEGVDSEYPGPIPVPTPASAATDEDSLYDLVEALCLAYEHHGEDVDSEELDYHSDIQITLSNNLVTPPKGPFAPLSNNSRPEDLETAAAHLDELRQRWNWHRLGVFSHDDQNDYATINMYPVTASPIGLIDLEGIPYIRPNYSDFFRYVNYLKNMYNQHISGSSYGADWAEDDLVSNDSHHAQKLNTTTPHLCTLPDATDLDSAFLIIYWIWAMYGFIHVVDGSTQIARTLITMDTTAGSASVTDVKTSPGGVAQTMAVGQWVHASSAIFDDPDEKNRKSAKVLSAGSGTATLSKKLLSTVSDQSCQYTSSAYHPYLSAGALATLTSAAVDEDEFLDPRPTSGLSFVNNALPQTLEAWISKAQDVLAALSIHMQNASIHYASSSKETYLQGNGPFFKPQIGSYVYAVAYGYRYTLSNGVEHLNMSAPVFSAQTETCKQFPVGTSLDSGFSEDDEYTGDNTVSETASVDVENLPELENDAITNYDTSEVSLFIYRTQDGGNTYYELDELDNGEEEFTDSVSDALDSGGEEALNTRATLYTTGGVVSNDPPPESKYIFIQNDTAYYGYVKDGAETFKGRIVQSVPGSPDAAPPQFFKDLPDELMGISAARNNIVALCRGSLYRISGSFNNQGAGSISHDSISDESTVGCISSRSIVKTEIGIFFAGTDGFYYTDGFQIIKISLDIDKTYAQRTQSEDQRSRISGAYDESTRRIWWTMQSEPSLSDCDECFVYFLNYGVKPSGVFLDAKNGENWKPSAITFLNRNLIRGDARGLIFKHNEYLKSDLEVPSDVTTSLTSWQRAHIPWQYLSCALDMGSLSEGNWVTKFKLLGKNDGNVNVQVNAIADNNNFSPSKKSLSPIVYRDNFVWGQYLDADWDHETMKWKYDGQLDARRRFPSGNLRSQLKQIELVPAFCGVYSYDEYPELSYCNVAQAGLTATLLTPSGYTDFIWPLDVVGMYIAFEGDYWDEDGNYVEEGYAYNFEISAVSDEVITFLDPDSHITGNMSNQKWVIRGYQKEADLYLLGYVIDYANVGERGRTYQSSTGRGENDQ
jgi:hypothetical protein